MIHPILDVLLQLLIESLVAFAPGSLEVLEVLEAFTPPNFT